MNNSILTEFTYNKFTFLNLNFSTLNIILYIGFLIMIVFTIYSYLKLPKKKYLLLFIRMFLLMSVLFIFLEPSLEYVKYNKGKKNIFFFKDNSKSLLLPLKSGADSRKDNLNYFFSKNNNIIKNINKEYNNVFYSFGTELKPVNEEYEILATENETRLGYLLDKFLNSHSEDNISSIIIASDFTDTDNKLAVSTDAIKKIIQRKIPLNLILPDMASNKDIFIKKIQYDSYAFVQNTTSIDLEIESTGYKNIRKKVILYRNNEILEKKDILLSNNTTAKLSFKFKPKQVGTYIYSVVIPPEKDEELIMNNNKDFIINIIRDKIRVVQVVGKPSWDVRFMRQLLKNHPDIDLVSFFILRTTNDVYLVPERELSLIPFPAHELFYDRLNSFDLIILQNFNYAPYGIAPYLQNIKDFVNKRGGGLVMIGGLNSFTAGGYKGTPIEDILPVSLSKGSVKESICYKNTHYNITKNGLESPFFKFANNYKKQKSVLSKLPLSEGFNKTILKKEATLIAQTDKVCGNKRYPLISTIQSGNGRTMAIATDSQWTWNFHKLMNISHKQIYSYFWDKAIKWLIKDPDMKLIKTSFDSNEISLKENLSVLVKAYDYHYNPLKNNKLYYQITNINDDKFLIKKEVKLDDLGSFQIIEKIQKNGRYKIEFKTYLKGKLLESSYSMFIVKNKSREFDNPQINKTFLSQLSKYENINFIKYTDSANKINIKKLTSKITEKKYIPIWDNIFMLAILLFLFFIEIYIKRYKI